MGVGARLAWLCVPPGGGGSPSGGGPALIAPILVLLRQRPSLLSVCGAVSERVAGGDPHAIAERLRESPSAVWRPGQDDRCV